MGGFDIQQIDDTTYHVLDAGASSFYVLEGTDRAAVIDTGITEGERIRPVIRKLTKKPPVLLVTHAHPDHVYHAPEFDEIYMSHRELEMGPVMFEQMTAGRGDVLRASNDIRTGSVIDLGGRELEVCEVPGHTPGSVVFFDRSHQQLFCGDAIGSGIGVWMQVMSALPLATYQQSLVDLGRWLVERGGRMRFFGGHGSQQFMTSLPSGWNPLGMGLLFDMIDLVDGIVKGTIVGRESSAPVPGTYRRCLHAEFGRAQIEYRPDNIQ